MNIPVMRTDYNSMIHEIRGIKVMFDFDLAALYGVETKRLKEQVRRNISRFPFDFMFELTAEEMKSLRSQNASSNRGGTRYAPMAFTEQGVAMLSSVLTSEKAIQINIEIMRAFANYRSLLRQNEELRLELGQLEAKMTKVFKFLLQKIDALHQTKKERKPVGFKIPAMEKEQH
jgi:hypothetical protein